MKYILFIVIISGFLTCSTWDARLRLVNNTNRKIRFLYEFKIPTDTIPDLMNCQNTDPYDISPNSNQIIRSQNKWDVYFKYHPNELLRIYIINEDSLAKYGTCKVIQNQLFIKRFDLTYEDIVKLNWEIEFADK